MYFVEHAKERVYKDGRTFTWTNSYPTTHKTIEGARKKAAREARKKGIPHNIVTLNPKRTIVETIK